MSPLRPLFLSVLISLPFVRSAAAAPQVASMTPAGGLTIPDLRQISVTFTEPVTGVDAADLEISGLPASHVEGSGAGPWTFTFTQPAPGTVGAAWSADHGIAGLGTGAFEAGPSWSYLLVDTIPPGIAVVPTSVPGQETPSIAPLPGSSAAILSRVEIIFNEPVMGVGADDLLVNGEPCATVSGEGAGPYVFTFEPPPPGLVQFVWRVGNGIVDGENLPFSGEPWSMMKMESTPAVVITEFLAANGGVIPSNTRGIRDEDFDPSGFVELTNRGSETVDLLGWSLTDDPEDPRRWVMPSRILEPGARLIVWTSAKDRKPAASDPVKHLHTNFQLNPNGGNIALFPPSAPAAEAASTFQDYPPQRYDYSYGTAEGETVARYFSPPSVTQGNYTLPTSANPSPTPPPVPMGAPNPASDLAGIAADPSPNVKRGYFSEPFTLILTAPDPESVIRFTLNGSVPTAASPAWEQPLTINRTTVLRMASFRPGFVPSQTITHSYVFPEDVLAQPSPPYDNPARTTDDSNPPLPVVGDVTLPIHWGTQSGANFPGRITNLSSNQIPADYGMDPKVYADPNRYADDGTLDPDGGITNADRIRRALRSLPMLSVVLKTDDMFGTGGIYPRASDGSKPDLTKPCSMELLLPEGGSAFQVDCGIDLHGNASRSPSNCPKHGFTIKFKGRFGAGELQAALFPDSPAREWDKLVLRGDYNSGWLHWDGGVQRPKGIRIRDAWAKDTFRDMGRIAGHARYTNLFINGIFWGTYDLTEDQTSDFGSNYFGGEKSGYDIIDQGILKNGTWTAYYAMKSLLGWTGTTRNTAPALPGPAFTNSQLEQIKQYLDLPWFVDYMLHHFFTGHEDWATVADFNKNWYTLRPPGGTFKYLPWDQENLLWQPTVNRVTGARYPPTAIHPRLNTNAEYKLLFADRAHRHLVAPDGALLPAANISRLQRWAGIMNADAMCLESARWGDYRYKVHQRSSGPYTEVYSWNGKWFEDGVLRSNSPNTNNWLSEIRRLTNSYFPVRTDMVLIQLRSAGLYPGLNAPQFRNASDNLPTGSRTIPAGYQLTMQQPDLLPQATQNGGTIYYTTDGNDPRIPYTTNGGLSSSATAYTGPITLLNSTTIKARALNGTTWSALMEATFTTGPPIPSVQITEIHYNAKGSLGGSAAEFLEIQNTGTFPVSIGLWFFEGIHFIFPIGSRLQPGERAVIASNDNPALFGSHYPGTVVAGYYKDSLSNGGERLTLRNASGQIVSSVAYDDVHPWPSAPDGGGPSLENINPAGDPQDPLNWRVSTGSGGTPGAANQLAMPPGIRISEFLATTGSHPGFVELHNTSSIAGDLGNCALSTHSGAALTFAQGTSLPAGSRLVIAFVTAGNPPPPGPHIIGDLPGHGGWILLTNATGQLIDSAHYGPQVPGLSFSWLPSGWTLTEPAPGAAGVAVPLASSNQIHLNEWQSDPATHDRLELTNNDPGHPAVLTGLYIGADGNFHHYQLPAALAPGGFATLHLDDPDLPGSLPFRLPASGGTLTLTDAAGLVLDTLTYPGGTAVAGSQGRLPDGTGPLTDFPWPSWSAPNYAAPVGGPVLNEILALNPNGANTPWATRPGWLEIRNPSTDSVDLGGWILRSGKASWSFPTGSLLPAGSEMVIWCDPGVVPSTAPGPLLNCGLSLEAKNAAAVAIQLVHPGGQVHDEVSFGWQIPDISMGRSPDGTWHLTAQPTPGFANTPAAMISDSSAVRINEWFAAPSPLIPGEFVELYHPGPLPARVGGLWLTDDPAEPRRRQWQIPANSWIDSGGHVTWLLGQSAASGLPVFALSSAGDHLRLGAADDATSLIDSISFGFSSIGNSMGRQIGGGGFSTTALVPTPGSENTIATAGPGFVNHPQDTISTLGGRAVLTALATTGSLQWHRNGQPIPGATAASLTLDPVGPDDHATYTVTAAAAGFTTTSNPARVTVLANYALWAAAYGAGEGTADDDGDGSSNFLEFLSGSHPKQPGPVSMETYMPDSLPNTIAMEFSLSRRAAYTRLNGEFSADLDNWETAAPPAQEVLEEAADSQRVRWQFELPDGDPRQFLRLSLIP